jgi:hypothetical protein
MKNKDFDIIQFLQTRPLSWSAISSFQWDKEQWYQNYILGCKFVPTPEMEFGKKFADSCEARKPMAPVTMLSKMEQPFKVVFNGIPLVGFADTFCDVTKKHLREYKTGVTPWTQKRANDHGQITMYALMNFITNKVRPEDCEFALEWVPTVKTSHGDFSVTIELKQPIRVHKFKIKKTMADILLFGAVINSTVKEMQDYVRSHA